MYVTNNQIKETEVKALAQDLYCHLWDNLTPEVRAYWHDRAKEQFLKDGQREIRNFLDAMEDLPWIKAQYEDRYRDELELSRYLTLEQQWEYVMTHPWHLTSNERIGRKQAMEKETYERKQELTKLSRSQHQESQPKPHPLPRPQQREGVISRSRSMAPQSSSYVVQERATHECQCLTKKGLPCGNPALKGQIYCSVHLKNCLNPKGKRTSSSSSPRK